MLCMVCSGMAPTELQCTLYIISICDPPLIWKFCDMRYYIVLQKATTRCNVLKCVSFIFGPSSNLETALDHCSSWPEGAEWLHSWRSTKFMFIISLCCLIVFHQSFWSIQVYIFSALPISCSSYHCAV